MESAKSADQYSDFCLLYSMSPQITVEAQQKGDAWECRVTLAEGKSQTVHTVTIERTYRDKLVGTDVAVEQLVRKSFEFLLTREPKESILRSFSLPVIGRYFPQYEKEMRQLLD